MAQIRPWLSNVTQHSDQICGIMDHIISSRAHWQGNWQKIKVKWDPHSTENTLVTKVEENCPVFRWL